MVKVTEEVRKNIEVRLKESAEFQTQLEKKLMEVEKEKQELQDDKRKAIESMEQQVISLSTISVFCVCQDLNSSLVSSQQILSEHIFNNSFMCVTLLLRSVRIFFWEF